ncbi:MAG: thiol-disulfide isomerase [Bryobacteraceae bacterium]
MSFLTYESTRPWAKAIREAVALKKMPPWFADEKHGKFVNDRRLEASEAETLTAWADRGAKEGSKKDAPPAAKFVEGWNLGTPDVVLEMPAPFEVPAAGTIAYQHYIIPTGFTEDRWVVGAEVRPGNRVLLHHAVAFIRPPKSRWIREAPIGTPFVPSQEWRRGLGVYDEVLDTYVPGAVPFHTRPGQAKLIPAGSDIVLQMHYTANGKAGTDRSRIGLVFAKEPPKERLYSMSISSSNFVIPPGAAAHPVERRFTFQENVKLAGFMPHMHLRGRSMEYRAVLQNGESQVLISVPKYDFYWQIFYYLQDQIPLPKGSRVDVMATFDNSPNNPRNPDASKEVRWGDQSWEEMMVAFVDVVIDAKMDPMDLHRPRPQTSTGADGR